MAYDVRTICLGILSFGEATGYEIRKHFEEGPVGHFLEASFSAIYPALARLEAEGLVSCRTESQDGRPDRKVYALTPAGEASFAAALKVPPGPDRFRSEFLFAMLFADKMPVDHLARLIDARIADYREELDHIKSTPAETPGIAFVRGHGIAIFEAALAYLKQNRHLLEANPARGAIPPDPDTRHAYQS